MASEAAAALLLEFFDPPALVRVDVAEQRRAAIEEEVGDGDDMDSRRVGAADVEATGNAALVAEIQHIDHLAPCGNWDRGRFCCEATLKIFGDGCGITVT